jgi:prevent-host-death family protein
MLAAVEARARPDLAQTLSRGYGHNDHNRSRSVPKKTLSVAEIKATLSERIRDVESGEPILVTRHGKPVAALVRPEDLETLERLRSAGPQAGLASVAGGWEGSEELVSILHTSPRAGQRRVTTLD